MSGRWRAHRHGGSAIGGSPRDINDSYGCACLQTTRQANRSAMTFGLHPWVNSESISSRGDAYRDFKLMPDTQNHQRMLMSCVATKHIATMKSKPESGCGACGQLPNFWKAAKIVDASKQICRTRAAAPRSVINNELPQPNQVCDSSRELRPATFQLAAAQAHWRAPGLKPRCTAADTTSPFATDSMAASVSIQRDCCNSWRATNSRMA